VYNNPTRSGYIIPEIIDQLAEVSAFCRDRQALSHKSRSIPQVALLLSETSLWDSMELSLHLLNRSNFPVPDRYNFIDFVPSVGPVKVNLRSDTKPKDLTWMPDRRPLRWTWEKGWLQTTIPSVDRHGILVVD
jgi:hypothetical protein